MAKFGIISLSEIINEITTKLNGVSSICISVITILTLLDIFARKFFNYSFMFVLEINTYLIAASWFLSSAYTLHTEGHIRITLLTSIIKSDKVKCMVDIFATIIGIIVSYIIFYSVLMLTVNSYILKKTSYTVLRVPLYIPQSILLIGALFLLIQLIIRLILLICNEYAHNAEM